MRDTPSSSVWEIGRLKLKPDVVWQMAMSSLKVRIGRTYLTLLTIGVSCAFLIFFLTQRKGDSVSDNESWVLMMGLSILVSAAGVLNTMLMSVTQRYREIGTMKCLGALDSFVLTSVLVEAGFLGLIGALGGVLAGVLIALLIGFVTHGTELFMFLDFSGLYYKVPLTFLLGMALTTFGASVPALIAAKMPPMDAMRGEK